MTVEQGSKAADVAAVAAEVAAEQADPTGSRPMGAESPAGVDLVNDQAARDDLRQQLAQVPEVGKAQAPDVQTA